MKFQEFVQPSQESVWSGFTLQYVSLILIVLVLVIGIYTKPQPVMYLGEEKKQENNNPVSNVNLLKSIISYKDLFINQTSQVNSDKVEALSKLLSAHDVSVWVEIYGSSNQKLAHSMAQEFIRFFETKKQSETVKVYVTGGKDKSNLGIQAQVGFYEGTTY